MGIFHVVFYVFNAVLILGLAIRFTHYFPGWLGLLGLPLCATIVIIFWRIIGRLLRHYYPPRPPAPLARKDA